MIPNNKNHQTPILWILFGFLFVGLILSKTALADKTWLLFTLSGALIVVLALIVRENFQLLKSRTMAFGLYSGVIAILVIGIFGVINYLSFENPFKLDLTKNKIHTLSDQTVKIIKELKQPVKAVFFSKPQEKESIKQLLNNYILLNPKFEVEYVDPSKELTRAQSIGLKRDKTLQLLVGTREQKIEDPNEEKITNALIKLLKEKPPTLCAVTGHGEKSFTGTDAEGYDSAKKGLVNQNYEFKEINLIQQSKIPDFCDVVAVIGSTKSFFEQEVKQLRDYLSGGGRAIIAVDLNLKGGEFSPELTPVLESWYIKPVAALIVDPLSKLFNADFAVPVTQTYSTENPITKDFKIQSFFPMTRPLEIMPNPPSDLSVHWLAQTFPSSWGVTDLKEIASGKIQKKEGRDKIGQLNVAVAAEGKQKDSKASKKTRLVVFGTSKFASNQFARFGGNLDFFLNSVSWLMEDENLISIRAKEEGQGKIEITEVEVGLIFWLAVVFMPLFTSIGGIVLWNIRRKL